MIRTINDLFNASQNKAPVAMVVAAGEDADVLKAVNQAGKMGLTKVTLTGDVETMKALLLAQGLETEGLNFIQAEGPQQAVALAMEQIRDGHAHILMKGNVGTADVLRGVLNKDYGQRTSSLLSHVAIMETDHFPRLLFVTDGAVNIAPDVTQKRRILENAVAFAHQLGYEKPNVGVICALEKVNDAMPATLDAKILVDLARSGDIQGCNVSGPLALDNALSEHSAHIKGITDPYAGKSDILLMPDIEAGNILFKAMIYLTPTKTAAVVLGAKIPVVLTSRSDSFETKLHSIATAVYMIHQAK